MNIVIVYPGHIPVTLYGGTERVVWSLGKALAGAGHTITFLVNAGSSCDFARVIPIDSTLPLTRQIPETADIVHFHGTPENVAALGKPYLITQHGNSQSEQPMDNNMVFISKNHALRYGCECYVHNGLDWSEYAAPDFEKPRTSFHFLGKAAWRVKNVQGAIDVVKRTKAETLNVIGGMRFNIKMGVRFTFSLRIRFFGMLGGARKDALLSGSKGLIFPVRWHEPFGLAIIESLYFGCPVFGTPYGSLPELVPKDVGVLSNRASELTDAVEGAGDFSRRRCHEYAMEQFSAQRMAAEYLRKYEAVLSGKKLSTAAPRLTVRSGKFLEWYR